MRVLEEPCGEAVLCPGGVTFTGTSSAHQNSCNEAQLPQGFGRCVGGWLWWEKRRGRDKDRSTQGPLWRGHVVGTGSLPGASSFPPWTALGAKLCPEPRSEWDPLSSRASSSVWTWFVL